MSRPNILLVILDSVRAKNTGIYGYHRQTTPFLADYLNESTLYTQARSPGIHSVASHASLWTGTEVDQHQVVKHEDQLRSGTTIWETLADLGYNTGIFTSNPVVAHSSNLSDPFHTAVTDSFGDKQKKLFPNAHSPVDIVKHEGISGNIRRCIRHELPARSFLNTVYHVIEKKRESLGESFTSEELISRFLAWQGDCNRPWAACLNLMDAHFPYEPAEAYDKWGGDTLADLHSELSKPPSHEFIQGRPWWQLQAYEHLYDGTILELDSHVETIVNGLKAHSVHDDTLIVVTSDHGEGFGEVSRVTGRTKLVDHSWGIHEVLTHVPLVVKYPHQSNGSVVKGLSSLTEFPGTVNGTVDGERKYDSFVSGNPVVASTYRLRQEDSMIFDGSTEDITDYYGPWRAVYEESDDSLLKYAEKDGHSVTIEIQTAQYSYPTRDSPGETVRRIFDGLDQKDIKKSDTEELSTAVENRLTELGYLR